VVSITVPGGTFEAVRIFGRAQVAGAAIGSPYPGAGPYPGATNAVMNASGDFVIWYAPQVKQVVRITWRGRRFWPAQYENESLLLVSYKLHNP
jgi:hypothetical protein